MKQIIKRAPAGLLVIALAGILLPSCYKKFDPKSYAPVFTIGGYAAVKDIQPSSMVAYWAFDGSLVDSVSSSAGTNKGTSFSNGFKGQALRLDVANKSYVTFTPGATITGMKSFTLSFWINPTFVDANNDGKVDGAIGLVNLGNVAREWGNIDIFIENESNNSGAIIKFHVTSGGSETWVEVTRTFPNMFGNWSSHTLTYDAASSKFTYYINGARTKEVPASWTGNLNFMNNGPVIFGCLQFMTNPITGTMSSTPTWATYMTGLMDEVRLYNTALSASDVNALVVLQGKGK